VKLYTHTFGCRVNQTETESIRERLVAEGLTDVPEWRDADVCVVNTCTVTKAADRDALRLVRKIARDNPAARLVVTGCYATRAPEELRRTAPDVLIVSNEQKEEIPAMLGCRTAPPGYSVSDFRGKSRAFVKVQDGCNMHCTYCIIPSIRPNLWTKPASDVEAEVRGLLAAGFKEIVLCGVRLGRYLDDSGRRVDFVGMLRRLLVIEGDWRLRLSSFEITDVTDRFLELYREFPGKLCPYLHVPLQSGSDPTLKRMERWYGAGFYRRRIEAARAFVPELALFTDIMTAFPGETEEQHRESMGFVEELGFAGLHVFRFSARKGTPAARYKQLPESTVERRSQEMRALDRELRLRFASREAGRERTVLVEKPTEGVTETFLRVKLEKRAAVGELLPVRILAGGELANSRRA
jgi:threonylcarbamoyladenosine tRNA methylthiotransferase MtaB